MVFSFFVSPLSQRYQKAAEEATAEKKRSVSICFVGSKQQPAIRTDHLHAMFLWQLIFGISKLLPCVLQQTWLRCSVCFWLIPPTLSQREWKKIKRLAQSWMLNHQFAPKQKAKRVNHNTWISASLFLAVGSCVVPRHFRTKFKGLLKRSYQPLWNQTCTALIALIESIKGHLLRRGLQGSKCPWLRESHPFWLRDSLAFPPVNCIARAVLGLGDPGWDTRH